MKKGLKIMVLIVLLCPAISTKAQNVLIDGELRPRTEFQDGFKTPVLKSNAPGFFTSERTRLGLTFSTGLLTAQITLQDAPKTFLGEDDCQWLHKEALGGCLEYRESNTKCTDPQSEFSGYLSRGVAALANYPGFGQDAFKKFCFTTCDTSKRSDYALFAKEVCSK